MHIDAREQAKRYPGALEAPRFTDLDGASFQAERPLSILEYNALEADYQMFLADCAAGVVDRASFAPRAGRIIEQMGWPVDRVLALPNDVFWAVLSGFFASPSAEGTPPGPTPTSSLSTSETPAAIGASPPSSP